MTVLTRPDPLLAAVALPRQRSTVLPPADATIPVGSSPLGVTLTPDGGRGYVANRASNTISVIDTATNTVTATIAAAGGPTLLAVSPDGTRAYVTLFDEGALGVMPPPPTPSRPPLRSAPEPSGWRSRRTAPAPM